MKKYCPRCGAKLVKFAPFCWSCGSSTADQAGTAVISPLPGRTPSKKRGMPKWTWWAGGVIMIALMALGVLWGINAFVHREPEAGATRVREIDGMVEVYIPSGEFLMGVSRKDSQALEDEYPAHTVSLDGYWIDQNEVTNGQYSLCVEAGGCSAPQESDFTNYNHYFTNPRYDNYPVVSVNWYEAYAYCEWAGGRLPTEAEWEKAARGTDERIYPWGDTTPSNELLNYANNLGRMTRICSFPDGNSPYGICDLSGNVWEWVNDWYDEAYYDSSVISNPGGATSGEKKCQRGGSYMAAEYLVRSSQRNAVDPYSGHFDDLGFRCAR